MHKFIHNHEKTDSDIPLFSLLVLRSCGDFTCSRCCPTTRAPTSSAIVEQGKFTLHKFEQPIGEETYEIRRDGDSLAVKMDFKFTDRGSPVPLYRDVFAQLPT